MVIKECAGEAVRPLAGGGVAEWLGFTFRSRPGKVMLNIGIAERAWTRLKDAVVTDTFTSESPTFSGSLLRWVENLGPCYPAVKRDWGEFERRVEGVAKSLRVRYKPSPTRLRKAFHAAYETWLGRSEHAVERYIESLDLPNRDSASGG